MTEVTEKTTETEPAADADRVVHPVHENCVWRNKAGSRYCEWDAVLPEGVVLADLADPGIWRRVQNSPGTALKPGDEIRIKPFDQSWVGYFHVTAAGLTTVELDRIGDVTPLSPPREHLFEDDLYRVEFVGNGYGVFRKSDGHKMIADSLHSPAAAQQALIELYPKRVA